MFSISRKGKPARVGWLIPSVERELSHGPVGRRAIENILSHRNVAKWLNESSLPIKSEVYRSRGRYDVIVCVKTMSEVVRDEIRKHRESGCRIVFDANVNYYDIHGDYPVPGTRPTEQQQKDAVLMTETADWVVADSSYLAEICAR